MTITDILASGGLLLFQGDSITDAHRRPDEANEAFKLGNGYVFLIAAALRLAHPEWTCRYLNRGISGQRVPDLAKRWERDCVDLRPDVLSLLIGINDVSAEVRGWASDAGHYEDDYRALIERARAARPDAKLVFMEPFALPCGEVDPAWMPVLGRNQAAVRRLARDYGAIFVPLQEAFERAAVKTGPRYWCYDGMHPTPAGFALIARAWLDATGIPA